MYFVQEISNNQIKLNISKKDLARDTDRNYKYRNPISN